VSSKADRQPVRAQLDARPVSDHTSNGILACSGDASLEEVAALMARNNVHAIVVVDDRAVEPPVISDLDLISAVASGRSAELTASDIAGTGAVSIFREEDLGRAAQLIAEHRVSHLVVRDERRQPIGIVSTLDLAEAISGFTRPSRTGR
jgi:CBS domain-containing protein